MKKILSITVALLLILGCCVFAACAGDGENGTLFDSDAIYSALEQGFSELSFVEDLQIDKETRTISFSVANEVSEIPVSSIRFAAVSLTVYADEERTVILSDKMMLAEGANYYYLVVKSNGIGVDYDLIITRRSKDPELHTHTYGEWVEELPATCTTEGVIAHYPCTECDQAFDAEYQEIAAEDLVIPALGHDLTFHEGQTPSCLDAGWRDYDTCSRCDHTTFVELPPLGHDYIHTDGQAPTCTEPGWNDHDACARCGYSDYEPIPPLGHDSEILLVHPTCTTDGYRSEFCYRCGYTSYEVIPATDHDYVLEDELLPTCTVDGYRRYVCSHCQDVKITIDYASGHIFGYDNVCDICGYSYPIHNHSVFAMVVDPTCTTMGYTVWACDCGYSYRTDFIEPIGHRMDEGVVTRAATCETTGIRTYTCTLCGETYDEVIPASHRWVEVEEHPATCTTDGYVGKICIICGLTDVETIPAHHTWEEEILEPGDCEHGATILRTCTVCGAEEIIVGEPEGHQFENGVCVKCGKRFPEIVTPDPDHPEYGLYFLVDEIRSAYGDKLVNEYGVLLYVNEDAELDRVAIYLTQDGTMWRRCIAFTGSNIEFAYFVPYLSHDNDIYYTGMNHPWINTFRLQQGADGIWRYSEYATIGANLEDYQGNLLLSLYDIGQAGSKTRVFDDLTEMKIWLGGGDPDQPHEHTAVIDEEIPATCTENGLTAGSHCAVCGEVLEGRTIIPAHGHHFEGEWEIVLEPTCLEEGRKERSCVYDPTHKQMEFIAPLQHNYLEIERVIPDCTHAGYIAYRCDRCQDYYLIELDPGNHNYVLIEEECIEATCTEPGLIVYRCSYCDDTVTQEVISAHDYQAEVVEAPTTESTGLRRYTCSKCGDSYDEIIPMLREGNRRILLVQNSQAWSSNANAEMMNLITDADYITDWTMTTVSGLASIDLYEYDVIYVALDDQTTATYDAFAAYTAEIASFAEDGGVVVYALCDHGHASGAISFSLPSGVTKGNYYSPRNYIRDNTHPIVTGEYTDGVVLDAALLYGNYCSHTYFTNLPADADVILVDGNGNPTLVEFPYGDGYVILSGLTWEYYWVRNSEGGNTTSFAKVAYDDLLVYAAEICDPVTHTYVFERVVEPTCEEDGYSVFLCEDCGKERHMFFTPALGHLLGDWTVELAPTCTEQGEEVRRCSRCGAIGESRVLPELGHDFSAEVIVEPTVESDGLRRYTCERCGYSYEVIIPHLEIVRGGTVLLVEEDEPWGNSSNTTLLNSLVSGGYIESWSKTTVLGLDALDLDEYVVIMIAADGSLNSNAKQALAARNAMLESYVSRGGVLLYSACETGGTITLPFNVVETHYTDQHNYIRDPYHPIVTAEYTDGNPLTDDDLQGDYCSHDYFTNLPEGSNVIFTDGAGNATLFEFSYGSGQVIVSGLTWVYYYYYYDYQNHRFSVKAYDDLLVYAMTVSGGGVAHDYRLVEVVPPTCLERGYSLFVCDECGREARMDYTDVIPHTYEWVTAYEPTCTEDGLRVCVCTVCGTETDRESIPALGHLYEEYTCIRCGYHRESTIIWVGESGLTEQVQVTLQNQTVFYYAFIPTSSGTVTIYSTGYEDTYGFLYNADRLQLTSDDDNGENCNFRITYSVSAGTLYYAGIRAYGTSSGTVTMWISGCGAAFTAENISRTEVVPMGSEVFFPDVERDGYHLLGWRKDGELLPGESFIAEEEQIILNAAWEEHCPGEWTVTIEPTCTLAGERVLRCEVCGAVISVEPIIADHRFEEEILREPTCTEEGVKVRRCVYCGLTLNEESIPVIEHAFSDEIVTPPTCTEDGRVMRHCDVCDYEEEEIIPTPGHRFFSEVTVEPTQETEGIRLFTCEVCGYQYEEIIPCLSARNGTVLLVQDQLPWDYDSNIVLLNRLAENGYIDSWTQTTVSGLDALDLDEYAVIMIANSQSADTEYALASRNSMLESYVERGGVLLYGACENYGTITLPFNVGETNYTDSNNYIRDNDHPIVTAEYTDGNALNDSDLYGNWCSHDYFTNLPADANVILVNSQGDPTLVEFAYDGGYCILSALTWECYYEHNDYNNKRFSVKAYDDLLVYAVSLSGNYGYEHHFVLDRIVDPTCTSRGYSVYVCTHCEEEYIADYTDMIPHDGDWEIVGEDEGCEVPRLMERVCRMCGEVYDSTYTVTIGHEILYRVILEPTCTEEGIQVTYCGVCGKDISRTAIPPLGHDYHSEVILRPTVESEGIRRYTCERCGDYYDEPIGRAYLAEKRVLLVQDQNPWGKTSNTTLLDSLMANGYIESWSQTTVSRLGSIELGEYAVVMIADQQSNRTYRELYECTALFENYVQRGGVIIYGVATYDGEVYDYTLPFGAGKVHHTDENNYIKDINHPIVTGEYTDGIALTNAMLSANYCSHDYFTNLPNGANVIFTDVDERATLFEYAYGAGHILYSGLTWECYYQSGGSSGFSSRAYDDLIVYATRIPRGEIGHEHDFALDRTVDPTCTSRGYSVYVCTHCGEECIADYTEMIPHVGEWTTIAEPTCLAPGLRIEKCTVCGIVLRREYPISLDHDYILVAEQEATCTEDGYRTYVCSRCDDVKTVIDLAHGHVFGYDNVCDICGYTYEIHEHDFSTHVVVDPGCVTMGYTEYSCDCGYTYRADYIEPMGHLMDDGVVTIEPTCESYGIRTYTCIRCGETYDEVISVQHQWEIVSRTPATCLGDGLIRKVCTLCGAEEAELLLAHHTFGEEEILEEGDCEHGATIRRTCTVCGFTETFEGEPEGHHFVNGVCTKCGKRIPEVVTPDPDHPEYGMYFLIDDIRSAYGDKLVNEYGVLLYVNEGAELDRVAIYLTQDNTMWRRCIAFTGSNIEFAYYVPYLSYGEDIYYTGLNHASINTFRLQQGADGIWRYSEYATIGVNLADYQGHLLLSLYDIGQAGDKTRIFDDLSEMKIWLGGGDLNQPHQHTVVIDEEIPATCTANGLSAGSHCSVCGEVLEERTIIPALGHNLVEVLLPCVMEDCTHGRYLDIWACTRCDYKLYGEYIPPLGHLEGEWTVVVEPTCTEEGLRELHCARCPEVIGSEPIPALGHDWEEYLLPTVMESCTQGRYLNIWYCTRCGEELYGEYIPPLGHLEGEWTVVVEPTCTEEGLRELHCARCPEVIGSEPIPALEHTYSSNWKVVRAATCTVAGDRVLVCDRCGEEGPTHRTIAATGHREGNWVVTIQPTRDMPGLKELRCQICGATIRTETIYYNTSEGLRYTLKDDDTYEVSGIGTFSGIELIIPSTYQGKPVTSIGEYAFAHSQASFAFVTIPDSVTRIERGAFEECNRMVSLTIGSGVTFIHEYAFIGCDHTVIEVCNKSNAELGHFLHPKDLYHTDNYVSKLSVDEDGFILYTDGAQILVVGYVGVSSELTIPSQVTAINQYAFYQHNGITSVTMSDGVTEIGHFAFFQCYQLRRMIMSDTVTSVGDFAFDFCEKMSTLRFSNQLQSIGNLSFGDCESLTSLMIPATTTKVAGRAFAGCRGVTSITVQAGNPVYYSEGNCVIERSTGMVIVGCKTSVIPEGVTGIGTFAFGDLSGFTTLTIPDSVTHIDDFAVYASVDLKELTLPGSVKTIDSHAFYFCEKLKTVTIEEGVETLKYSSFYLCSGLTTLTIPKSLTIIENSSFALCGLKDVYYYGTEEDRAAMTIGSSNDPLLNATWHYLGASEGLEYTLKDDGTYEVTGIGTFTGTKLVIPATYADRAVTSIGVRAFLRCENLISVVIPEGVTSIGERAFAQCYGLNTTITIPSTVTEMGEAVFIQCHNIPEVVFDGCRLTTIANGMFYFCGKLAFVEIPSSVTSIGSTAFMGTAVTSVVIPDSVTVIGSSAFYNCSNLVLLTLGRNLLLIGDNAFEYCGNLVEVYNRSTINIQKGSGLAGMVAYYAKNVYTDQEGASIVTIQDGFICYTEGEDVILVGYVGRWSDLVIPSGVTVVNDFSFSDKAALNSVVIPEGVTTIGRLAFSDCQNLSSITIPESMANLEYAVLYLCSSLNRINYAGTKAQWDAIRKNADWASGIENYSIYCSDGVYGE